MSGLRRFVATGLMVFAAASGLPALAEPQGDTRPAGPGNEVLSGSPIAVATSSEGELDLGVVLASAERHFPLLLAVQMERGLREAELQAARGAFDTRVNLAGDVRPAGFYESYGGSVDVSQQTRLWGSRFDVGYRYGGGDYPSYEGKRLTDGSGEVFGGATIPLGRGGFIDGSRAKLERRELDLDRVDPEIDLERIKVRRDAARAYWVWVAAGLGLDVAEELLQVAVERQGQIEGRVRKGAEPEIDLIDNEQLIVDRRLRLRGAQRDFERASISLSLFLRDEVGQPVRVSRERLPAAFPAESPLDPAHVEEDIERARNQHPLVQQIDLKLAGYQVDEKLARNELLPAIDFKVAASQDFGSNSPGIDTSGKFSPAPRGETEFMAGIRVELPIQRRGAKGRLTVARSRVSQLEQRLRFERERIVAEVQRAVAGLDAAYDQTGEARHGLMLAEKMRRAEERKLSLGLSNLIDVNIRELQAAAAAQALIEAQAGYFLALADYEAAAARPPIPPGIEGASNT
jgi:outer membrane protein TolC